MARLTLNVDQADFDSAGRTFDPVLPGDYKVTIFSITPDEVKSGDNKGKPRLKFQFRIAEGETDSNGTSQANRRLFTDINAFPSPNKEGKLVYSFDLVAIAKAIGLGVEDLADTDTDDWLGEELQVSVTWRRKQEKVGDKWVDIEPAQYRENVRGYRSLESVQASAANVAKVNAGAKASTATASKAPAKKQLIKL